jgi:hypothetical protein
MRRARLSRTSTAPMEARYGGTNGRTQREVNDNCPGRKPPPEITSSQICHRVHRDIRACDIQQVRINCSHNATIVRHRARRMNLPQSSQIRILLSLIALAGAMFILLAPSSTCAAELVIFEQAGCEWCEAFNRDVAPIYPKTEEGRRAPLRRVDIAQPLPQDLAFIDVERLTPLFVLIDKGREIGRIRGYPGEDNFWGLLGALIKRLDGTGGEHARFSKKPLRADA